MSIWTKLNPNNFFTKEEIKILLFLILFTTGGVILKNFDAIFQIQKPKNQFENTDIDSILVAVFSDEKIDKSETIINPKRDNSLKKHSIDLNKATVEELIKLPGIGENTAMKIIEYRQRFGGFKKIEELMRVERIGQKTFEKIKDYLIIK
ncbi:MAG: ComEA family DNA-binding protein [Ignavibacteria bacterium]|jgi:comEA protein|nr:ComEA family DNA-binding protein [Ignavibacteria bacterium]MDH7528340.1 ComEA family DNA-binding protein [Ignavibacteria bacterium]